VSKSRSHVRVRRVYYACCRHSGDQVTCVRVCVRDCSQSSDALTSSWRQTRHSSAQHQEPSSAARSEATSGDWRAKTAAGEDSTATVPTVKFH